MKETDKDMHGENCESCCGSGHGMYGWGRKHFALRIVLMLVIIAVVFCMGVKIGELKAEIEGGYGGFGHMRMMKFGSPLDGNGYWDQDYMMKVPTSTKPVR